MDFHIVLFAQFEIVLLFEVILIIVQIIAAGFGTALQLGLENLFDNKELIALFGGFAGILELSRKKKGTVLSGVAIATALMPPLCTVGYGLSLFNARYIFGALYLFIINSIYTNYNQFWNLCI